MDLPKRIKEIREEKGFKQIDIADKMGIEASNYNRFEKRGKKLTIEQLEDIAGALGVTIKDILFDEESTPNERELEYLKRELEFAEREIELMKKENKRIFDIKTDANIILLEALEINFALLYTICKAGFKYQELTFEMSKNNDLMTATIFNGSKNITLELAKYDYEEAKEISKISNIKIEDMEKQLWWRKNKANLIALTKFIEQIIINHKP